MSKRPKVSKIIIAAILFVIIGGFALNLYLTHRLQNFLNEKLSEEVFKATDGFYQCSFKDLSVGFFSGELSIKGITLKPDSAAFAQWEKGDSLPDTYYKINIGEIHFRGINLTWRRNYRDLDFSLFELKSPDIEILQPVLSSISQKEKHENKELGSLYDIVSPYIGKLTVGKINFTGANVSYTIEDSISPIVYKLKNVSFRAYNFRLDENSTMFGKLLYCDNFEFHANEPQQLLYSDQIILETDNVKLSTIQSAIKIEGVKIFPKEEYWNGRQTNAGEYLQAEIKLVEVNGVEFTRKSGRNYLSADAFNISSTDINYFNVKGKQNGDSIEEKLILRNTDTLNIEPWSLYSIISPILNSISIDKIGIEKTRFNYTLTQDGYTDAYLVNQFDLHAKNFLVDSLSEKNKKLWYVDNFQLTGDNIIGQINSNNSEVAVTRLLFSTEDKYFNISDVKIKPISKNSMMNYLYGDIKTIDVNGLDYDGGVKADELLIDSVNIKYFDILPEKKGNSSMKDDVNTAQNILDIFSPYASFLSVKDIKLQNANLAFFHKEQNNTYKLNDFNFFATDFLIDEKTRVDSRYLFTCENIGFSFRNFDNLLPENDYRLMIKNADFSTKTGKMKLLDVDLKPQKDTWGKAPDVYYDLHTPSIELSGFDNGAFLKNDIVKFSFLSVDSLFLEVVKTANPKGEDSHENIPPIIKGLSVDSVKISNTDFKYQDKILSQDIRINFTKFSINRVKYEVNNSLHLGDFILQSPIIKYIASESVKSSENRTDNAKDILSYFGDNIKIDRFVISYPRISIEKPEESIDFGMNKFSFSGLDWNKRSGGFLDLQMLDAKLSYIENMHDSIIMDKINLNADNIVIDISNKIIDAADFSLSMRNISFPVMDNFYHLFIGNIELSKSQKTALISDIKMKAVYPKMEFAYKHPRHKDWFDVEVGKLLFTGFDYVGLNDKLIKADKLYVRNVVLQNFKNQQIEITHNVMPLIYEKIQNLPMKLDIKEADVSDFSVLYEELPKKGSIPGRILFDNMNGKISGLTNIASRQDQYIFLDIDGVFMNEGFFTAKWNIPVSKYYDCFTLETKMKSFDLSNLNEIFAPLAKAEIKNGILDDFSFKTEATSKDAHADMLLLYNNMKINILKDAETKESNKVLSQLTNLVLKSNNPNKEGKIPRRADIYIERDPYHSTFNYFWQILQPAVVESVGVSQGDQRLIKKITVFFAKIKGFFSGKDKEEKNNENK